MIRIEIDGNERLFKDASQGWIHEQINRRLRDAPRICVRVRIEKKPEIDLVFSTPDCPPSGAGSRDLTPRENEIVELWKQRGLWESDIPRGKLAGNLWAFLQRASRA